MAESVTRELPVRLTEPELLERGDEMAKCDLEIIAHEAERKEVNEHITRKTKRRRELAGVIDACQEMRQVPCVWEEDFEHNAKRLRRLDTGEEIDTVAMTGADRQEALGLGGADDAEYREEPEADGELGKPEFPPDHEGAQLNS